MSGRVLHVTAECQPMAKVGGLGEATAGLTAALSSLGWAVETVLPDYGDVTLTGEVTETLPTPDWADPCWLRRGVAAGFGPVSLVGSESIRRPHPYTDPATDESWPDNDRRFLSFSAGVAAMIDRDRPDLVHLHDWHGAASTLLARRPTPTILTIHNVDHHGLTSLDWVDRLGPASAPMIVPGHLDPLVGAIRTSDAVVTVSPRYRQEICSTNGGGIGEILTSLGPRLHGILNGVDGALWDPAEDPRLWFAFDRNDLRGKEANRRRLLRSLHRSQHGGPVVAMVARLTPQKGIDLIARAAARISAADGVLIIHGEGRRQVKQLIQAAADADPDHVVVIDGYDETTAHRLIASADLFLMPSRFEPCGLTQLQSMTYGTIPIVTDVGGLHDTVVDDDAHPGRGTGFVASAVGERAIGDATRRAIMAWHDAPRWSATRRRAMNRDWSWDSSATAYERVYRRILGVPGPDRDDERRCALTDHDGSDHDRPARRRPLHRSQAVRWP